MGRPFICLRLTAAAFVILNPDRRQIARSVTARQLLGIALIGLDTVAGLDRYQGRCDHLALYT
jgi:hypothetical protein